MAHLNNNWNNDDDDDETDNNRDPDKPHPARHRQERPRSDPSRSALTWLAVAQRPPRAPHDEKPGSHAAAATVRGVCVDVLAVLLALHELAAAPIVLSGCRGGAWCAAVARVCTAQAVLARAMDALSAAVLSGSAREDMEVSSGGRDDKAESGARLLGFPDAGPCRKGDGEGEGEMVRGLENVARELRLLTVLFAQSPLREELRKVCGAGCAPLDVLGSAADWMEAVAGNPFWEPLDAVSSAPRGFTNSSNPHVKLSARHPRRRNRDLPHSNDARHTGGPQSQPAARDLIAELGISPVQWAAARLIYKLRALLSKQPTLTINAVRRPSALSSLPLSQITTSSIPPPPLLTRALRHLLPASPRRHPAPALALASAALPRTTPSDLLLAIHLHHVRRALLPFLGPPASSALSLNPSLAALRLAVSRPDVFVAAQALDPPWPRLARALAQQWAWDALACALASAAAAQRGRGRGRCEVSARMARVGALVWVLAAVEDVVARGVRAGAWAVAGWVCVRGGGGDGDGDGDGRAAGCYAALREVLAAAPGGWVKTAVVGAMVACDAARRVWPLVWGSALCAGRGQPGLLGALLAVAGGVVALVRFKSRLFVALEISGMFVVWCYAAIGLGLMGLRFVGDPLGLDASTAMARARGEQVRRLLPRGASAQVQILRETAVSNNSLQNGKKARKEVGVVDV